MNAFGAPNAPAGANVRGFRSDINIFSCAILERPSPKVRQSQNCTPKNTIAAIESGVPLLVEARAIITAFQTMIRRKTLAELEPWLERARASLVASFASGVLKDRETISAAITSPWSNGQTEGQITKLKLVKRQMYGRGKLDLLQVRVIGPS